MVALAERPLPPEQDFGPEAFYEKYGEKTGISREAFPAVWDESQSLMPPEDSTEFPVHNRLHPRKVVWTLMEICDREEARDPSYTYNRRALILAGLFHDVRFDEDHSAFGFESKEGLSAYEMFARSEKHGFSLEDRSFGQQIIMGTKRSSILRSREEKAMVEADINNVGQDYETVFLPTFFDLAAEEVRSKKTSRHPFSSVDFARHSLETLCTYINQLDADSDFVQAAIPNLRRLATELRVTEVSERIVNRMLGLHLSVRDPNSISKI